ncbi:DNA recombination protein RmuC [Parahaliea aestuarii]|uniref:DNA recombination protein RmuC n=1 Tax=Parahaliea aestuarii TaxID=1852021 RepID=A0A5C8ZV55_9GAMM|nr:DNA recombination protein RmuC [Parahaliea aestuarii]TXS92336.1 DNA recombination protein RmuC [Parahaliea aestuarii]
MELDSQQLLLAGSGLAAGLIAVTLGWLLYRLRRQGRREQQLQARYQSLEASHRRLQQDYAVLEERSGERERQHREQLGLLNEHRDQLKREFENLANRIFEERSQHFASHQKQSLETLLQPFREQIGAFQQRVDQVHSESLKGQASLAGELRRVLEIGLQMNEQAGNLAAALKGDKKATGNWGEAQLERSLQLAGLQAGQHYEAQAALRDEDGRRKLPDFLIKLPDGKHLVIDSKVSLVDYDRAIAAGSDVEREAALSAHVRAVRQHMDDLAGKDYAHLPNLGSPDFVLMFLPVEPAFIEALRHSPELFNDAYQRGVVLVSHTTLMPVLRTVANLWMVDRSNREAREISNRAGEIYNQVSLVAQRLNRLGNSLRSAGNHYNDTVRALAGQQGLQGKVERFQQLSGRARREMPELTPIHNDLEQERLVAGEGDTESAVAQIGNPTHSVP